MSSMVFVGVFDSKPEVIKYFKESMAKLNFNELGIDAETLCKSDKGFIGYMLNVFEREYVRVSLVQYSVGSPKNLYFKIEDIDNLIGYIRGLEGKK